MVRSQTPAISAAAIQLILLAIAFKITSCSFIIRSSSAAETFSGVVKLQHPAAFQNRTTHVLIGPDNSHASDRRPHILLTSRRGLDSILANHARYVALYATLSSWAERYEEGVSCYVAYYPSCP